MRSAEPEVTAALLAGLQATWPAWKISRGEDLLWRARHETWPGDVGLAASQPGALDRLIATVDDVAAPAAGSDPSCLGCVEALTMSPQGWRAVRTGLLTCRGGITPGRPHSTTLPRGHRRTLPCGDPT